MSETDSSPKKAPPAGIKSGLRIAATSHISALFIPLDFIASKSLEIASFVIFPFNQHQKTPGLADKGGFAKDISIFVSAFLRLAFKIMQEKTSKAKIRKDKLILIFIFM
jgi:hypothetical protein